MRACPHCLTVYEGDPEFCAFDGARTSAFAKGADPLAGLALDRYTLGHRLGVGGTGCVYLAHDPEGNAYALKLLYGEMATDKSLALRFRREAEAMRRIDHPNVVKVVETRTSTAGLTYLVMEHVEGRTLKAVIEREAPLAPGRVGRLAEQLVAGLARAHHLGYVHRDLKPSNVMISGDPGSEVARILDFGIVASLRADEPDSRLTKTGYIVGTPTYMAPEQVDPKQVTPQADVYALGVMLHEMLAGEPPFTGTLEQILVSKMTAQAPRLEGVGELGPFVARLLAMDPAERPANALHVSAELSRMSLLSPDPATEKARAWEHLPDLAEVGFGAQTLGLATGERTDETPLPGSGDRTALDEETPESPYAEFQDEEAPTTAVPRRDTLLDPAGNPLPQIFPETSAPTTPGHDDTSEDALAAGDGPTRVAAVSGFGTPPAFPDDTPVDHDTDADPPTTDMDPDLDVTGPESAASEPAYASYGAFGADRDRPASEASARRADEGGLASVVGSRPRVAALAPPDSGPLGSAATEIDPAQVQDTTLDHDERLDLIPDVADLGDETRQMAPVEGLDEEDDEDVGFADTRIRPSHIEEGTAPQWGVAEHVSPTGSLAPAAGFVTVRPVPAGLDPADVAATSVRRDPAPNFDLGPGPDDPTALSGLENADPGDADTALDLVLEERIGGVSTDLSVDADAPATGSVPTAPSTPAPGRPWGLGLLVMGFLVAAAAITYAVLDSQTPVVIEPTPTLTPELGSTP